MESKQLVTTINSIDEIRRSMKREDLVRTNSHALLLKLRMYLTQTRIE